MSVTEFLDYLARFDTTRELGVSLTETIARRRIDVARAASAA
jgi:hypothetical protein